MHRVISFAPGTLSRLRPLWIHAAAVALMCSTVAHAATSDGLTISGSPAKSATVGHLYSFTPTVADPSKRTLQFVIVNKPCWAAFSTSSGQLSGTPTAAGVTADVLIKVTDGVVTAELPVFNLTVTGASSSSTKPTISGSPAATATVGQAYAFTPTVTNPSNVALTFTIVNKPSWASFSTSSGKLSGTPAAANVGVVADILIRMVYGGTTLELPEFSIRVAAASTAADKPVISGTPATSVVAGSTYKFQPTAKDPDGKTLSFSVVNKPSWASFSISSGLLDGTPTTSQVGSYADIVISASNGQSSTALPGFNVAVTKAAAAAATGSATVDWVPPTKNTNGSALTDLAGIRIYYGTSAANLSNMVQVASPTATSYTIADLAGGMWYFAGAAYTTTGAQSALSSVVSASIP